MAIRLKKLGSKHVEVANNYNNLGTVYRILVIRSGEKSVMIVLLSFV